MDYRIIITDDVNRVGMKELLRADSVALVDVDRRLYKMYKCRAADSIDKKLLFLEIEEIMIQYFKKHSDNYKEGKENEVT